MSYDPRESDRHAIELSNGLDQIDDGGHECVGRHWIGGLDTEPFTDHCPRTVDRSSLQACAPDIDRECCRFGSARLYRARRWCAQCHRLTVAAARSSACSGVASHRRRVASFVVDPAAVDPTFPARRRSDLIAKSFSTEACIRCSDHWLRARSALPSTTIVLVISKPEPREMCTKIRHAGRMPREQWAVRGVTQTRHAWIGCAGRPVCC